MGCKIQLNKWCRSIDSTIDVSACLYSPAHSQLHSSGEPQTIIIESQEP